MAATENGEFRQQIREEQIEILFRHAPLALTTNLVVGGILAAVLWDRVPHRTLLAWCAAVAVLFVVRAGLVIGYRRRASLAPLPWHTVMTWMTALSGIIWGTAGLLFFVPGSSIAIILVTIVLAGMAAGSVPSYSAWPPAQIAYAVPTMALLGGRYLYEGGDLAVIGALCFIFLFNVLTFARQLSRSLLDSLRLRHEKQGLVEQLSAEKAAAEEARLRAEEANVAKSRFLAAASHDLRQPLHAVSLFVEALRHERDHGKVERVVEHLGASALALEELLNELLDISKLDAGLFKPQVRVVAMQALFERLEREMRALADEKGIELGFVATRLKVHSDPQMLGRILRNIIANAIRYTTRGAVLVGCRRRGDHVTICVYDTGPGIAPEHQRAIFREFYQLGNPERDRRKGLGLGLAIVDGLCQVLHHAIRLRSQPGRGSLFSVDLPRADDRAPLPAITPEENATDFQGHAVLVIDDEPAIRAAMIEVLSQWGCPVLAAESGAEAIALLSAHHFEPDVIVSDYRLREGRTGSDAIAEVRRALGRDVPAAILTGDTAPERLVEASASGFLLLHKPLQPARLRAALANLREEKQKVINGALG